MLRALGASGPPRARVRWAEPQLAALREYVVVPSLNEDQVTALLEAEAADAADEEAAAAAAEAAAAKAAKGPRLVDYDDDDDAGEGEEEEEEVREGTALPQEGLSPMQKAGGA